MKTFDEFDVRYDQLMAVYIEDARRIEAGSQAEHEYWRSCEPSKRTA